LVNIKVCYGQKYASKDYYLIDSLVLEELNENDRSLIDSCLKVYHTVPHDTSKIAAIEYITEKCINNNIWPKYNQWVYKQIQLLNKTNGYPPEVIHRLRQSEASALNNMGYIYNLQGNISKALEYFLKSLEINEETENKKGVANALNNIGYIYKNQGDITNALIYLFKSLKIQEEIGDKGGMATSLNNIGFIYMNQDEPENALDYFFKSLKIREEINDKEGMATSFNNIGNIYISQNKPKIALDYFFKSLKLREEIGDKEGMATSFNNIGTIYMNQGELSTALDYFFKSLNIYKEAGNKAGIANTLNNIGTIELKQGKKGIASAKIRFSEALAIAQELGFPELISRSANHLTQVAKLEGNFEEALKMYELYITMLDSIFSEETQKEAAKQQAKYEYEKQKAIADKEYEKQMALSAEREKRQRVISYATAGGLILVLSFLLFVFNRLQITKKQKEIIEQQKTIVEQQKHEVESAHHQLAEHHKETQDSINYAKRIQDAMLSSEENENPHLPEHFIFFKPKDIVSGDFYWVLEKQDYLYIAVADSTGHGVPGAFMSMLGMSFLNEINSHEKLLTPAEILNELRRKVIKELRQTGKEGENKDGMDISLIRINLKNNTQLMWAGANNPLYHIKKLDGKQTIKDVQIKTHYLKVISADKQAIGYGYNMKPFTNHEITIEKKDILVLFTDGFADQFGGPHGKKFKYKPFKKLLLDIKDQPMSKQKTKLETTLNNWQADNEQVDDICVVGLRI
jgi:serine phosphatase RsbU (regulator of sigma subunit)